MKKTTLVVCVLFVAGLFFSACSKSPVGPSMSSLALSSNATCPTGTTGTTTCATTSNGGATSVSTAQTGSVSTRSGDTGVTSVNVSTGVNSSVSGSSSASASTSGTTTVVSTGGTMTMTLSSSGTSAWGAVTVVAGSSPRLTWTVSGVTGISSYLIWVYSVTDYSTAWYVESISSSTTSVVYGAVLPGAFIVTAPVALKKGSYNVIVHALDAAKTTIGYANGVITVN